MKQLEFMIEQHDGFIEARTEVNEMYMIFGGSLEQAADHVATYYHPMYYEEKKGSEEICRGSLLDCILFCNKHYNELCDER